MNKSLLFFFFAFAPVAAFAQPVSSRSTTVKFSDTHAIFQHLQSEYTQDSARTVEVLVTERFLLTDTVAIDGKMAALEYGLANREKEAAQIVASVQQEKSELQKIKDEYKKKKGKKDAPAPPAANKKEAETPAPPTPNPPAKPKKKKKG